MTRNCSGMVFAATLLLCAGSALAQTTTGQQTGTGQAGQTTAAPATTTAPAAPVETRPATTTYLGDTGLWFVPTAEILPNRRFSASAYYVNFDRQGGSSDIGMFPITFGFGLADRVEVFGNFSLQNRIDRDTRPLFDSTSVTGGAVLGYPYVRQGWQTGVGDLMVGAKFNILAEHRQQPAALAVRAGLKFPTSDYQKGLGSGKTDFFVDAIVSKEINQMVELSGYGGFMVRAEPDDFTTSNSFRWGFGAGVPTRSPLRLTAELWGEAFSSSDFTSGLALANALAIDPADGSFIPTTNLIDNPVQVSVGATYQLRNGFFVGGAGLYNLNVDGVGSGSKGGFQFRLGYHPGVRIYAPPPPPPPPPAPAAPENKPPTVKARCEPCTVEVGQNSTVTADAQDPDGDTLTYRWSAPTGKLANPADRQTVWTAPMQEGPVQVTVRVDDGKGGTASDTVTIQVVAPPKKEYVFEDVHFDFDRYTLRPEALRVLDEAIKAMQADTTLRLTLEGHTCNIGTAEYNLALGERRANAVRDYLISRGITADRLRTVSFGEERPKYDNSREETRRLNRRAALVARLQ